MKFTRGRSQAPPYASDYTTVFSAVVCMYPRTLGSFFVPSIRTSTTSFITYSRILDEKSSKRNTKKKGLISERQEKWGRRNNTSAAKQQRPNSKASFFIDTFHKFKLKTASNTGSFNVQITYMLKNDLKGQDFINESRLCWHAKLVGHNKVGRFPVRHC